MGHVAVFDALLRDARTDPTAVCVVIDRIAMMRSRSIDVCIGLHGLDLPALVTLEILDALIPNAIRMMPKWDLVTAAKHFHEKKKKKK